MFLLLALGLVALAFILAMGWQQWQFHRRRRALIRLLDLADAVEALLDRSQQRMTALRGLLERVPPEIGAVAQASLESGLPIRDAKRDVLQHRLWIQKNGDSASLRELGEACATLERVQSRLSSRLQDLERAGGELATATDAATEAARREPAALRRHTDA